MSSNIVPRKVLVVGSNPSHSAKSLEAFHSSTSSGRRVRDWFGEFPELEATFVNVSDVPTKGNKPLSSAGIREGAKKLDALIASGIFQNVFAVGETARKALSQTYWQFTTLPHPSGRCRKHNDAKTRDEIRDKIRSTILE